MSSNVVYVDFRDSWAASVAYRLFERGVSRNTVVWFDSERTTPQSGIVVTNASVLGGALRRTIVIVTPTGAVATYDSTYRESARGATNFVLDLLHPPIVAHPSP